MVTGTNVVTKWVKIAELVLEENSVAIVGTVNILMVEVVSVSAAVNGSNSTLVVKLVEVTKT